jgi:hypothetical protein
MHFGPGSRVRITCGPLEGLEGIVAGEFEPGRLAVACSRLAPGVLIGIRTAQVEPIFGEDSPLRRENSVTSQAGHVIG